MSIESIGDLIDKLSIINIKIWDATQKANLAYQNNTHEIAHELFNKIELMNIQRKDYINSINSFFNDRVNHLNQKSFDPEKK